MQSLDPRNGFCRRRRRSFCNLDLISTLDDITGRGAAEVSERIAAFLRRHQSARRRLIRFVPTEWADYCSTGIHTSKVDFNNSMNFALRFCFMERDDEFCLPISHVCVIFSLLLHQNIKNFITMSYVSFYLVHQSREKFMRKFMKNSWDTCQKLGLDNYCVYSGKTKYISFGALKFYVSLRVLCISKTDKHFCQNLCHLHNEVLSSAQLGEIISWK